MAEDVRTEVFEKIYPENAERKTEIADNIDVYGGHTQQELNRPPLH